jgi:Immunity protein 52
MWPIAIVGQFRSRPETPDSLAGGLAICLARLAELDPLFEGWIRGGVRHRSAVPRLITLPPDEGELRTWIAERATFGSRAKRKQHVGYSIGAMTPASNPIYADFSLQSGSSGNWLGNGIRLMLLDGQIESLPNGGAASLGSLSESFFRDALTIVGTAWECEWAAVMPCDLRSSTERASKTLPKYHSGWMVYLDQSMVHDVGNLDQVIVETLANGAILMTAVRDMRFNLHNPIHRAAAERIQAALAPLNGK